MDLITSIREKQNQLVMMINSTFDELVEEISQIDKFGNDKDYESAYELSYSLVPTNRFKGKKPIAVIMNGEKNIIPTWKMAVSYILQEVVKDEKMYKRVLYLRDKLLGRVRTRISSVPDDMRSPLKISEELYIETHYDTETLLNLLVQILNEIKYDYTNIKIIIKRPLK